MFFLQNELVKRGVEIEKLHELLDQQQRLALQDKKLLEGFCCKVFQKIYFSVKLRKKTERTE